MSDPKAALLTWLEGLDLCSVYPVLRTQRDGLPCIVLETAEDARLQQLDGPGGCAVARFSLHCMADTWEGANTLHRTVRGSLDGFRGKMTGVQVQSARMHDYYDDFVPSPHGGGGGTHKACEDVTIFYEE